MLAKFCILVCFWTLFVQNITSQCIPAYNNLPDGLAWGPVNGLPYDIAAPWGGPVATPLAPAPFAPAPLAPAPFAAAEWIPLTAATLSASNGKGLAVTSASPIAPTGIAMTSENSYEGVLAVTGALPFLAAVSLEGVLPTSGVGAVTYSCGNGNIAILNEEIVTPANVAGPLRYNGLTGPLPYNGLAGPLPYNGLAGPLPYNGLSGPLPYNGLAGPCGY